MTKLPPIKLPPCDHDECPPTRCTYEGDSTRQFIERNLANARVEKRKEIDLIRAKLAAAESELSTLRELVTQAAPIVRQFAQENPLWTDLKRVVQDPYGAHKWVATIDAARKGEA